MRRRLVLVAGALVLAGCELPSFGAPDPASREGSDVASLWKGFFITAIGVAVLVYGLILYVTIRYRRRGDDEAIPSQKAHNIRMEIIYTATPIVVVAVLFGFSVAAEQRLTRTPDDDGVLIVEVTSFQWGWQFEYPDQHVTVIGSGNQQPPEMVLPVDEKVRLVLRTADVIHSFWVPRFLEKRDLIQGIDNTIDITPTEVGRHDGFCAEFCGLDHWRMRYVVDVRTRADFDAWVRSQQ